MLLEHENGTLVTLSTDDVTFGFERPRIDYAEIENQKTSITLKRCVLEEKEEIYLQKTKMR
jgi:hypothetical protein